MAERTCPHCGTQDYGTPFCVSCQRPFVRDQGEGPSSGGPVPERPLSGFFRRFFAFFFDIVLLSIIADLVGLSFSLGSGKEVQQAVVDVPAVISLVLFILYFTLFVADGGQTLGKKLLGIRVVSRGGGDVAPYSWLYIPQKELGMFNRISFPSNYSTAVAPENCGSILAEITYNDGDTVSNMADDELIRNTVDGLTEMGLLTPSDVTYASVFRQKFAYVVYDLEYQDNVVVVRDFVESMGIHQVGRFAEFEYLNMDGCIRHVFDFINTWNND